MLLPPVEAMQRRSLCHLVERGDIVERDTARFRQSHDKIVACLRHGACPDSSGVEDRLQAICDGRLAGALRRSQNYHRQDSRQRQEAGDEHPE